MPKAGSTLAAKNRDILAVERLESLGYSASLPLPVLDPPSTQATTVQRAATRSREVKGAIEGREKDAKGIEKRKSGVQRTLSEEVDEGLTEAAQESIRSKLPPASKKKETLTLEDLRAVVESHRFQASLAKLRKEEGKSVTPSKERAENRSGSDIESSRTGTHPSVTQKRELSADPESPPNSPNSPASSTSSQIDSPTRRYSSPSPRKRSRRTTTGSLPLLSLLTSSVAASSLISTCESLVHLSPGLSLPDLVHLSQALQDNAQMLAIAQSQALGSGRTFGSSFDTLARLIASPARGTSRDPSSSAFIAAKALNLFDIPAPDRPPLSTPTSPSPPLLILTTPRRLCRQCQSPLTIRSKPSGPFSLISPSEPPRPILVASHVCTNTSCRARHSADHVEISHLSRKVWIWEEEPLYVKVGDQIWVTREFTKHFAALLLQQHVSPGGFAEVWNSLHVDGSAEEDGLDDTGDIEEEEGEDLENEVQSPGSGIVKISPSHVWRSFVIHSSIQAATNRNEPLLSLARPSCETLVRFANRYLFPSHDNVYVLDPHECLSCSKARVRRWRSGPASAEEKKEGVRWAGSSRAEVLAGLLKEDTELLPNEKAIFGVCDGIAIGHFLCAFPSCSNPPAKQTRNHRFCKTHLGSHNICGIIGCNKPVAPATHDAVISEACSDPGHTLAWEKFLEKRKATRNRGWRGWKSVKMDEKSLSRNGTDHEGMVQPRIGSEADRTATKQISNTWSLRRVAKLQLLIGSCGTPLAWSKLSDGESPRAVLRFFTLVHAQLALATSPGRTSFPSYIAYDRACDVLREAALSSTTSTFQNPFETPKKRRRNAILPLPSFLQSSRLVVTGFHQQCHSTFDKICQTFCNSAPLDASAPDLVIPYASIRSSRPKTRVFERAFNTSAAEQLNSSLRGFTHLLQGMRADNFDFLVNCILKEKKDKVERKGTA